MKVTDIQTELYNAHPDDGRELTDVPMVKFTSKEAVSGFSLPVYEVQKLGEESLEANITKAVKLIQESESTTPLLDNHAVSDYLRENEEKLPIK